MTVNRTTLLDLPLPVTGTESGTWGDTTNNGLTQYVDIAIAGMSNLTSANFTAGALTIETTEGDSSATNISATSAQYAGFRVSSLAVNSTITVGNTGTSPARSYRLINADATYSLTFKATGQTGVTLLPGQSAVVAFNGTDYVIVGMVGAGTATDNAIARFDGTTGEIVQNSVVTIADSTGDISGVGQLNATTVDATNVEVTNIKAKDGTAAATIADSTGVVTVTAAPVMTALTASQAVFTTAGKALTSNAITGTGNVVMSASPTLTGTVSAAAATLSGNLTLSGGTANGVLYLNGSKVATSGSALTFDGTTLTAGRVAANTSGYVVNPSSPLFGVYNGNGYVQAPSGGNIQLWSADTSAILVADKSTTIFNINASEQMRLTSTGLGIGTSSPAQKLSIQNDSGNAYISLRASNTGISGLLLADTDDVNIGILAYDHATNSMQFRTNDAERMRLDSSGNLGLGITPSAWGSTYKATQIGTGGSVNGRTNTENQVALSANAFHNGTAWTYIGSTSATQYQQAAGVHYWFNAPSGTAGNAITFTQAMTLDADGDLGVGTTSPTTVSNYRAITVNGTNGGILDLKYGDTLGGRVVASSGGLSLETGGANVLAFYTNNTERARITSGGDLLVGSTTGASARLYVQGSGTTSGASAFRVQDSATADIFIARNDGQIFTGTKAASPYNNTTAAAANMVVDSGGILLRSTSALKYKKDIRDLESTNIDALRPVRYKSKCNNDDQTKDHLGLIADEAAAVGFEELVTRNSDGEIEGFQYERLTVVLLKEIQSLRTRLAAAGI